MTRILGIDPGSRVTGFGVIETHGSENRYVASGCIRVRGDALAERLREIFEGVSEIVQAYSPVEMAIEKVFVKRNVDSALKLGQARGAAIVAAVNGALPVHEYTPAQVKQAVVGKGNATKEQVQHMIRSLLGLPGVPQADAADALAIALCHTHRQRSLIHIARHDTGARRAL